MTPRLPLALLRAGLRLYPERFRQTYGDEMETLFCDRWRDAAGALSRCRLTVRTLANLTVSAAAEHRRSSFKGSIDRPNVHQEISRNGGGLVASLLRDAQYALRMLWRQPAFSLFLVLTLAVGIGANTAVFSVVNGVLLKPLPFAHSEHLVAVWGRFDPESGFNFPQFPLSNPEFVDYKQASRALEDIAAWSRQSITVGGSDAAPERAPAAAVSANLFSLLRVAPVAGRTFRDDEDRPRAPSVAIVSYGYWRARFGGDPSLVGRAVPMNGVPTTVIGIMPEGFTFPGTTTKIWVPLGIDPASPGNRKGHGIRAIGRLAQGSSLEAARAELTTIMAGWKAQYPDIHTGHYLYIRPLLEDVAGSVRPALLALLGATAFVLLIVCANVASLMMARGEARTREMAIRSALGAQRARLVRLSLVESSIIAALGGGIGIVLANVGVRLLLAADPSSVPRSAEVGIDASILAFAAFVSLSSAVVFGLVPAIRGASPMLQDTLRDTTRSTTAGAGRQLMRRTLVAVEVALGVILLFGAGLMLRSFDRLLSVDPGFRPAGVLMANVSLPPATYKEASRVEAFYAQLMTRLRSTPGIHSASAASGVPLWNDAGVWDFEVEGRPRPRPGEVAWNAAATVARSGFFETLGIPLANGRFFTDRDDERGMTVAVINQAMVARFFAGEDPIGRRIRVAGVTDPAGWMTIVGIARDIRDQTLDTRPRPTYYLAHEQTARTIGGGYPSMSVLIRTDGPSENATAALRSAVRELDPGLPVFDVQTVDAIIDQSVARPRFTTLLLSLFAFIGIVLGATGIYGVLAYTVTRRTQEIGIRRALGAQTSALVRDVIAGGMLPVAAGLVLGIIGSFWATGLLKTQLFEISPTDGKTYTLAVVGVIVVSLLACVLPARRALRVNPIIALRAE
jgi:putative ABC transport system permease protein